MQESGTTSRGRVRRAFDWAFRSRSTGRITVMQWPNLPLLLFLVLRTLELAISHGTLGDVLHWAGSAALAWWAVDETLRGVNPFRRALGAAVLVLMLLQL